MIFAGTAAVAGAGVLLSLALGSCGDGRVCGTDEDLTEFVDPMIGTDFTGNTYPGAQVPFGMVQLSPDNGLPGWDRISGYFYPDSTIAGFSHTHLSGTGAGDLYDVSFMPVRRPLIVGEEPLGVHSKFSHSSEEAKAGFYKVHLTDYDIDVELTATERCGVQRYTFPEGECAVILNLAKSMNWDRTTDSHIEVIDSVTVAGYRYSDGWARNQKVYFATRFSKPFASVAYEHTPIKNDGGEDGTGTVATFDYQTGKGEQLTVVTALSPTGMAGALANLKAEGLGNDFDVYRENARDKWNKELRKVELDADNLADEKVRSERKTVFYTALYHSMLAPTVYCDVNGDYAGPDGKIHHAEGWTNYSTFSLWDTYRASHPLFTVLDPERAGDMAKSLVEFGLQLGRLPVWNMWGGETDMMIGYHSAPVIVDAILKGIGGKVDAEKALDLCVATARKGDYRQLDDYMNLGYVPSGKDGWSMSKTLEYAFDDYCIAQLALKLGKREIYDEFMTRAANYTNTFNPATGFFEPRDAEGKFPEGFVHEAYVEDICESNAWQYLFSVQHDLPGLMKLMGGKEHFEAKLDSMFSYVDEDIELPIFSTGMLGQYAHGNEPGHHAAYLYNMTDNRWKGADRLYEIMNNLYTADPDGICGNDDCGQMSAWYVFSALGFYPVNPVGGEYELGVPMFRKATVDVGGGKKFVVKAPELSAENRYVKSVSLNGKPLSRSSVTHAEIMNGGELVFEMAPLEEVK
ncbi:MAG: GH92 family glycosyl hydrolase [Muribaculaceae bacterium]|nr:GH92 family glycosyl hydrolase [Muribaculaceae bacterium]